MGDERVGVMDLFKWNVFTSVLGASMRLTWGDGQL